MKKYQSIILFAPDVMLGIKDEILEKIKKIVKVTKVDEVGLKRLPYSVKQPSTRINYSTAYYVTIDHKADEEQLEELEKLIKKRQEIIKHINVKTGEK